MNLQQITHGMCQAYLKGLTSLTEPEKRRIQGWIRARNLRALTNLTNEIPEAFATRDRLEALMQLEAFYSKNTTFEQEDTLDTALAAFLKAEARCRITNRRVAHYVAHPARLDPQLAADLALVKDYISFTLGSFDKFFNDLPTLGKVTSGATDLLSRRNALPWNKVGVKAVITCTRDAKPYLTALSKLWGYSTRFREVVANRVEFVPKNWKTRRTIACEPSGNLFLQLAFDQYAKVRLRNYLATDLSDQSLNQRLARLGSTTGLLATIDLKMASDTIAINTVAALLPDAWYRYLRDIRSGRYFCSHLSGQMMVGDGNDWYPYAKFSSMGNGATFALETLIFASCCKAVTEGETLSTFGAYGDDLIVPTASYGRLLKLLKFLGFEINTKKSFHEGPFRESCGGNYYNGADITPTYLRWEVQGKPGLCHVVNAFGKHALYNKDLAAYLTNLVWKYKLPEVPLNADTCSGVWIAPGDARAKGLLRGDLKRFGPWIEGYKAYAQKADRRTNFDSRSLFTWYLRTRNRDILGEPTITTEVTVPCAASYGRKWVCYNPLHTRATTFSEWRTLNL